MRSGIDVEVSEVGPRDGLQSIKTIMPTEDKKKWVSALAAAGMPEIEVGSFVHPKIFPQLADTAEIVAHALTLDVQVAVLVPNKKGAENALKAGAHKITIPLSCSEEHSIANVNRTHEQMYEETRAIAELIKDLPTDQRPKLEGGLSTAFGCTIVGEVPEDKVVEVAEKLMAAGCNEVGISDTTGYANPATTKSMIRRVRAAVGDEACTGIHIHNTRGLGLANALAALEEGLTTIDSSMGGIGGCPAAPGASGNIVTEDLVFMLDSMGLKTGIDFDKMFEARRVVQAALPDEPLYGFTPDAGIPKGYKPFAGRV